MIAALLTFAAALFLTGCSNPAGLSSGGGSGTETPNRKVINAKWEITDKNARFTSIELTEAQLYIVIERDQKFYTGKYTILEDSTVHLANFGTLHIDLSQSGDSAAVRLQLDTNVPPFNGDPQINYEFNAERAVEIDSSKNTELLCRHWNYVRFLLNGELWEPWENPQVWEDGWEFPHSEPHITNLFSKAGTYLQTLTVDGEQTLTVLGQWRWSDENENAFYYTSWQTGAWQTYIVNVVTLTENSFAIEEMLNDGYILITEFELF
ncbi:MAG: hypothetical protein FWE57_07145 [Chitinispirillia bacterium]|nr:hypothetical protein [Chitinispirillia bacterium]